MRGYRWYVLVAESLIERNGTAISVGVAIVLALVAIWFSWFLYRRGQTLRTFDHRVVSDLAILSRHERPEYIKVMAGGLIELKDPRITTVRFKNTGGQVIDESDFREPYVIIRKGAKLLEYSAIDDESAELVRKLEKLKATDDQPEKLLVYPAMLNRGKEFTLKLIYDGGADDWPVITGQFFNQSRDSVAMPSRSELSAANEGMRTFGPFGFIGVPIGIAMLLFGPSEHGTAFVIIAVASLLGGIGYLSSLRAKRKLYRRRQTEKPKPLTYAVGGQEVD